MNNKHTLIESVEVSDYVLEEVYGWYSHYKSIEDSETGANREYGYTGEHDVEFNEMLTYILQYMH